MLIKVGGSIEEVSSLTDGGENLALELIDGQNVATIATSIDDKG